MKKCIALLLALVLLAALAGCGQTEYASFRALEVIGEKQFSAICRGGDKLAPVIAAALETLAGNGMLSSITARWLGKDRSCLEGDAGALRALEATLEEPLPETRRLIVGVEQDYDPIGFTADGRLQGLSVDLANALGELLGWDILILPISSEEVQANLVSGNVDCALGFDGTLVKADKFSVSAPYLKSDIIVAVRAESEVKRLRDLKDCRVGVVNDPAVLNAVRSSEKLTKYASGATEYLSLERCINALDRGWCAAIVMDSLMLSFYRDGA
jgi:ABC-type amino acid transport substrate-binding protein